MATLRPQFLKWIHTLLTLCIWLLVNTLCSHYYANLTTIKVLLAAVRVAAIARFSLGYSNIIYWCSTDNMVWFYSSVSISFRRPRSNWHFIRLFILGLKSQRLRSDVQISDVTASPVVDEGPSHRVSTFIVAVTEYSEQGKSELWP